MTSIAQSLLSLSMVAVLGLGFGKLHIRGVSLGLGGVLFSGILVGRIIAGLQTTIELEVLHFLQEFGLILFVYSIGNQLGPGFFASLRNTGLKLNLLSGGCVVLSVVLCLALFSALDLPLPVALGILSGAVTNTPSLAATQQVLEKLGFSAEQLAQPALGYAVAYPFGIIGILLAMWALRVGFKVAVEAEHAAFSAQREQASPALSTLNVRITNENFHGLPLSELPDVGGVVVICSRIKRDGELMVPNAQTRLHVHDVLHLVGPPRALHGTQLALGEVSAENLTTRNTDLRVERVVVTDSHVLGKSLTELGLDRRDSGVISRIYRAGVDLLPRGHLTLHFGDVLNVVGKTGDIAGVAATVGNARRMLDEVQMIPIFLGIGLGVLLGSLAIPMPGLPTPIRLGLAGGPLIASLILSRLGSIGTVYWFMPPSANRALRELGIVLFLSVVGLKAGSHVDEVLNREGLIWLGCGAVITLGPLLTVGVIGRLLFKLNYLTLCGLLAGSCTDPPALAFANNLSDSEAPALAYASVYPVVMALRILAPQVIAIMVATFSAVF